MGSRKKLISILFSWKKINFPAKMPLKCSNNAQCFCLTKILEKMLQPVAEMLRHSHEKNNLSCFKSLLVTGLWDKILTPLLPPFKVVPPSFEHGLVLLATLKRGGGGITSTRSWTGNLSQNTVQCLKYFCNWLSHLRFTSKSDFHVSTSQSEDYSEINK